MRTMFRYYRQGDRQGDHWFVHVLPRERAAAVERDARPADDTGRALATACRLIPRDSARYSARGARAELPTVFVITTRSAIPH